MDSRLRALLSGMILVFCVGARDYEALIEVKGIETQKIRLSPVFVR